MSQAFLRRHCCVYSLFLDNHRSWLRLHRRHAHITAVESLTTTQRKQHSDQRSTSYRFAVKDAERGLHNRGLSPDAHAAVAEAETQYKASSDYLHALPGGVHTPEKHVKEDGTTVFCITAPFGETYVPSHKERHALRGHVGELKLQHAQEPKYILDAHAELNLRKERQLQELLSSPIPLLEKGEALNGVLSDFYTQRLTVSSRQVEAITTLWAQCSLEQRMNGNTIPQHALGTSSLSSAVLRTRNVRVQLLDTVPFLHAMKRLYFHARATHVAPTPLVLEHIMTTISALSVVDKHAFHLANRLLLDADKYVLLPTRTTYAAFFTICSLHNAMPFALARFKDAVVHLHIAVDATMATALLKGLNHNGLIEEALALLARLEHIPLDVQFLNAALEVLLLSSDPQALFSVFEATRHASIQPTAETFTLLLLACERSGLWGHTTRILAEMQARRIKGDAKTLNLLLKGLLMERLHGYAEQLYETMTAKGVEVWSALDSHMTDSKKRKQTHQQDERRRPKQSPKRKLSAISSVANSE